MRTLSSLILLTAGFGVAAYAYSPTTTYRESKTIGQAQYTTPTGYGVQVAAEPTTVRLPNFAPAIPLLIPRAVPKPLNNGDASALAEASDAPRPRDWTPVVVRTPVQRRLASAKPGDYAARYELARELQKELRRVGCYGGEIDGSWGSGSKRAMSAFTDRVNASLPVEEPDYILLSLVQNHSEQACGDECPIGQALAGDGRCLPKAIIRQAERKTHKAAQKLAQASSEEAQKLIKQNRLIEPPTSVETKKVIVTAAKEPTGLPWQKPGYRAPREIAVAARTPTREPLPGRMSVGGPVQANAPPQLSTNRPGAVPLVSQLDPVDAAAHARTDEDASPPPRGEEATSAASVYGSPVAKRAKPRRQTKPSSRRSKYKYAGRADYRSPRRGTPRFNLLLGLGGFY